MSAQLIFLPPPPSMWPTSLACPPSSASVINYLKEIAASDPSQLLPRRPRPLPVGVDRDHLARNRFRSVGSEEYRQRRDILGIDHSLDRLVRHRLRLDVLERAAAHLCPALEHTHNAVALYGTGRNSVDADAPFAEFHCQRLGQSDHAPFRGGVGTPVPEAEADSDRAHVDYDAGR